MALVLDFCPVRELGAFIFPVRWNGEGLKLTGLPEGAVLDLHMAYTERGDVVAFLKAGELAFLATIEVSLLRWNSFLRELRRRRAFKQRNHNLSGSGATPREIIWDLLSALGYEERSGVPTPV